LGRGWQGGRPRVPRRGRHRDAAEATCHGLPNRHESHRDGLRRRRLGRARSQVEGLGVSLWARRTLRAYGRGLTMRRRDERGSAAIELTLLTPVLLVILLFVVGLGRMAHARQQVEAAAADSARAASLERNTALSRSAAHRAAKASLGDAGV